jgi:hypothetical protein
LLAVILLTFAGPWRPAAALSDGLTGAALTPAYRARLEDNDRFYGPMAQAGRELRKLSEPGEVVVVAHYGPVIAYYADRRYLMLYTLPEPAIMQALDQARLLVWDTPSWLRLPADRVPFVEARVAADFQLLHQVGHASPVINIYEQRP